MSKHKITRCTVYGLREKGTDRVRYIGQTSYPIDDRLYRHWQEANKGNKTARSNWMRSIRDRGGEIEAVPLEENAIWNEAEIKWISHYRGIDDRLLNHSDGGQGTTPGTKFSKQRIENTRKGVLRAWEDEDLRKRHSEMAKARCKTDQGKEQIKKLVKARMDNEDAERRRIEASRAAHRTPEYRRAASKRTKEQMSDQRARDNIGRKNKARYEDPKQREAAAKAAKKGWQDPVKRAARIEKMRIAAKKRHARERAEKDAANG